MKKAILAIAVIIYIALSLFILIACNDSGDKDGDENILPILNNDDSDKSVDENVLPMLSNDGGNNSGDEKVLSTFQGVVMITEKSTYPSDVQSIHVVWKNNTEKSATFGNSFYLEKKVDGGWKWEKVELTEEIYFTSIGYMLFPNAQSEHTYHINSIYGNLKVGNYRIATHYYDTAPATANDAKWVFAEFALVNKAAETVGIQTDNSLFSEYGIEIVDWYIWNDFMPMVYLEDEMPPEGWIKPTYCVILINSEKPLPAIEVSATIILATYRLENIPFHENSGWRPMIDFNIGGDYTMEITIQLGERQQTVVVQGTVQATC